jgi:holo-[acyl-carrier protein] synthase
MILGVGADLVAVERIRRALDRSPRFAAHVFHPDEIAETRGRPQNLAARFAAKEAWLKAMGLPLFSVALPDVRVRCGADGRPVLQLADRASALSRERGVRAIHLSLAHEGDYALAWVVLEGGNS